MLTMLVVVTCKKLLCDVSEMNITILRFRYYCAHVRDQKSIADRLTASCQEQGSLFVAVYDLL